MCAPSLGPLLQAASSGYVPPSVLIHTRPMARKGARDIINQPLRFAKKACYAGLMGD